MTVTNDTDIREGVASIDPLGKAHYDAAVAAVSVFVAGNFPVSENEFRALFQPITLHGPEYDFSDEEIESGLFRMNHFSDPDRRQSECMSWIYETCEQRLIPEGYDFAVGQNDAGDDIFVRYDEVQNWPAIPESNGMQNVNVSVSKQNFSDGTNRHIVTLDAGTAELTHESLCLLIDQLRDAEALIETATATSGKVS
ncbi:hypothetical protein ACIGKR_09065 [Rhodococcus qingshengii]|uniref:hypothetical protein n=1 Tax=Rhodococcus qingshengii TaxID=334542 RepID=UPI0037C6FE1A